MARFRFPGDPYADRGNAEERAREAWQAEQEAHIAAARELLSELESAVLAENLPAIERTQETLAEAVEALREARHGPTRPEPEEKDYDAEDGL